MLLALLHVIVIAIAIAIVVVVVVLIVIVSYCYCYYNCDETCLLGIMVVHPVQDGEYNSMIPCNCISQRELATEIKVTSLKACWCF